MLRIFFSGLLIIITLFFSGCNGNRKNIVIAAIIPLSGSGEEIGNAIKNGITLAIKEINKKGGIDGSPLELVVKDNKSETSTLVKLFDEIENAYTPVVYISAFSYLSFPLAQPALNSQVPLLGLAVGAEDFTSKNAYCYRFAPNNDDEISSILSHCDDLGIENPGIISLNDQYGKSLSLPLKEAFEKKGNTVKFYYYETNTIVFDDIVQDLLSTDGIFAIGLNPHIKKIYETLERNNYQGALFGASNIASPEYKSSYISKTKYIGAPYIYNSNFIYATQLKNAYTATFNKELDHYSAGAYETTNIIANILEHTDHTKTALLSSLTQGFSYMGVFGEINAKPNQRDILFPVKKAKVYRGTVSFSE